ncbi:MAG: hypothetical protein V4538_16425 [Bacteroidota bacterium]
MDFKAELIKLQQYCIENRNYLKASERSSDRTAADAYQDVRNKITDVFEREKNEINTSEPHLPLGDVSGSATNEPENCEKEWVEKVCDGCIFKESEKVSHPGGDRYHSVDKHKCGWGHWEEDF